MALTNGAQACNVFWQVGSSATLGGSSTFVGTLLADTAITLGNLAEVEGRVLASTAAVSLSANVITRPDTCRTGPVVPVVTPPVPVPTTPVVPPVTTPGPVAPPTAGPTTVTPPTAGPTTGALTTGTPVTGTPPTSAGPTSAGPAGPPATAARRGSQTTYSQVDRVPVGSVDTGDGSTS